MHAVSGGCTASWEGGQLAMMHVHGINCSRAALSSTLSYPNTQRFCATAEHCQLGVPQRCLSSQLPTPRLPGEESTTSAGGASCGYLSDSHVWELKKKSYVIFYGFLEPYTPAACRPCACGRHPELCYRGSQERGTAAPQHRRASQRSTPSLSHQPSHCPSTAQACPMGCDCMTHEAISTRW